MVMMTLQALDLSLSSSSLLTAKDANCNLLPEVTSNEQVHGTAWRHYRKCPVPNCPGYCQLPVGHEGRCRCEYNDEWYWCQAETSKNRFFGVLGVWVATVPETTLRTFSRVKLMNLVGFQPSRPYSDFKIPSLISNYVLRRKSCSDLISALALFFAQLLLKPR